MFEEEKHGQFWECIEDLVNHPMVRQMREYRAHGGVNCFDHSLSVSYMSFLMCRKLGLDYVSAARGGLLHDLFLYDWREKNHEGPHCFTHPKTALCNASKICSLNEVEQDIILKHMWPLCSGAPRFKESVIVSTADKICATIEALKLHRFKRIGDKLGASI